MDARQAYDELTRRSREIFTISSVEALVGWDQQVNMPPKGVSHRATMMAYLAQLAHQKQTAPRVGELLVAAESASWEPSEASGLAANVREWRRSYNIATKLPEALVRRRAELTTRAHNIWEAARAESNFAAYAPVLSDLVDLTREIADRLGWQGERYDALLDLFEPGLTTAQCDALFRELRIAIIALLQRVTAARQGAGTDLFRSAIFPKERQREFGLQVTRALGFDYAAGRLDISAHPFTQAIFPGDVRLTTRYDEHNPFQALMGTIHEAGHGMYEQGLPLTHVGTPLGQVGSLGLHESQSRFFENNIARSRAFWSYWFPRFQATFAPAAEGIAFDDFYRLLNRVTPSLIRVEADEVTYNLHIIVRFEIERDLFRDKLRTADLPEAWNARYREYLGVEVPTDALGVLQDIHWSMGSFGYFPTYSLGTVYAAQLEAALRRAVPDLDAQLAAGEFGAPLDWMRTQIHQYGMHFRPAELIQHATGQAPAAEDYVSYLTRKYGELYQS